MTCNPFTSAAAKNSTSIIRPENIDIQGFNEILNFEQNSAKRFNKEKLGKVTSSLNEILRNTDLRNHDTLKEKLEQSPINSEELAEYLLGKALPIDNLTEIIDNEINRRDKLGTPTSKTKGTIGGVELVDYPIDNEPDIIKKVPARIEDSPRIIRAKCKGNVREDCSFSGVIYDLEEELTIEESYSVMGHGEGIEGIDGNFKLSGTVDENDLGVITFDGAIAGDVCEPRFIVFYINIMPENNRGNGATFNVVIGKLGLPITTIANPGSGYNTGDVIELGDLGVKLRISRTVDLAPLGNPTDPLDGLSEEMISTMSSDLGKPNNLLGAATNPIIPMSNFSSRNYPSSAFDPFAPAQPFIDLVNNLDLFLNDNYGSSISSGLCGSSFLSILSSFFDFFKGLSTFEIQSPNLSDIWESATGFSLSVPSMLGALQEIFNKITDTIMASARQTISNVRNSIRSTGASAGTLIKEIMDLERFYSDENQSRVQNLSSSIMQKMHDQFNEHPLDLIMWILTRLCQLSSFINDFLSNPIDGISSLLDKNTVTRNGMSNLSNTNIAGATTAGAVRLPAEKMRMQAAEAAQRSNAAGKRTRTASNNTPSRITGFPITEDDKAEVVNSVSDSGWPGFFTFAGSVISNNFGPEWGERFEGAGWKVIVRDNPILFAKLKKIIQEVGGNYRINSAYRSQEYQETRTNSSASRSAHTEALACDIRMTQSEAVNFVPIASANGFNGITYYAGSGFLHVDLRTYRQSPANRSWNSSGLTRELRNVINNHQNKLYNR